MSEYNKEQQLQEEIKALREAEEGTVKLTNEVSEINTPSISQIEISEVEKQARALGWKSKEEREAEGKTSTHYVEPDEYVRRQPLFERIDRQNKELRELKESQRLHALHLAQVRKEAYDQAQRDLESRREIAIQDANIEEFRRLDAQSKQLHINMTNDPIMQVQETPLQIPPEVAQFQQRNQGWYNTSTPENAKMKAAAEAVDNYLMKQSQIDGIQINPVNHLNAIEAEVKRLFPHRFEAPKPVISSPVVNNVGKSTAPTLKDNRTLSNLSSRLTPQQRELGEKFARSNPEYTLDVYAADLEKMGRLGK